jgi:uncharacterized protein
MITKIQDLQNRILGGIRSIFSSKVRMIAVCLVLLAVGAGVLNWNFSGASAKANATEINWRLLAQLDYMTGQTPAELEALDGKYVKVPGFMVPLEDESRKVTEFLLVPSPQACIHVPPPPPNQMVYVKMQGPGTNAAYDPIWIFGTFHLKSQKHQYGEASFSMTGMITTPYR